MPCKEISIFRFKNQFNNLKQMSKRPGSNFSNIDTYPCKEEADLAQKCLDTECFDHAKCSLYFENFKQCKKFWGKISSQRRKAGISPAVPTKSERDRIIKLKKEGIITISCNEGTE